MRLSFVWLITYLTIGVTNSAFAVVDGHRAMGGTHSSVGDDLAIRQNTVRFVSFADGGYVPFCSGIQSGNGEVISAAHCFSSNQSISLLESGQTYAEVYDPSSPRKPRRIRVAKVEQREDQVADLAVVRLERQPPTVPGIPLALAGCDASTAYKIAGFGVTESNRMSENVRVADYRTIAPEELRGPRKFIRTTLDNHAREWLVLKKTGAGSICPGDSGGPIFCRSRGRLAVAGITANIAEYPLSRPLGRLGLPKPQAKSEFCRDSADTVAGTLLSASIPVLENLRARLRGDDGATAPAAQRDVLAEW